MGKHKKAYDKPSQTVKPDYVRLHEVILSNKR